MEKVYIFGHKKPDTDSVCASISLAYLKNQLGMNAEARVLGDINNETKFALNYFNVKEPRYLNDVKLQIRDVDYIKECYMNEKSSINDSYIYMKENNLSGLPIVDDNKKLTGLVTLKELARELIQGEYTKINTSYDNILKTLNGKEVLRFDNEIKGNVMAATFRSTTFMDNVELHSDDILIVGDRQSILEYATSAGVKLIIVVGDLEINEANMKRALEHRVNIIKTPNDSFTTTKLISLSNYIKDVSFSSTPISFDEKEYYSQFEEIASRTKHTNYPIINKKGECLGLMHITFSNKKHPKKVILVDHNEKTQTADGIDEANIIEVFDHHKLGTLATSYPINFRNMAVGSSCTIIYSVYKENKIDIPPSMAGLMLSGILSDTLILKSPTTTQLDRTTVFELEKIASVDHEVYGLEMFKAGSSLKGKTKEDIIYTDFKKFSIEGKNIGICQVFTSDVDSILDEKDEYIRLLDNIALNNDYEIVAMFITDIIKNGSYILYNTKSENVLQDSYDLDYLKQGHYFQDFVSRKKQFIPPIMENLEKH